MKDISGNGNDSNAYGSSVTQEKKLRSNSFRSSAPNIGGTLFQKILNVYLVLTLSRII